MDGPILTPTFPCSIIGKENNEIEIMVHDGSPENKKERSSCQEMHHTKMPPLGSGSGDNTPHIADGGDNNLEVYQPPMHHHEQNTSKTDVHDYCPLDREYKIKTTTVGIRRPVGLQPSSLDPTMSRPALYFGPLSEESSMIDLNDNNEETDILQNLPKIHEHNIPIISAPQLRIRPIHTTSTNNSMMKKIETEEKKMPSPLARRGAAEIQYVQTQLKAEARQRRKQERHNEDRKMRVGEAAANNSSDVNHLLVFNDINDIDFSDGYILNMMDKFKLVDTSKRQHNGHTKKLRDFASSPPMILKKTFNRSVSDVLKDSGLEEDGNLLFYPSGEQIQYEDAILDDDESVDEPESPGNHSTTGGGDNSDLDNDENGVEAASPKIQLPGSSTVDEELSPSLIGAACVWQFGSCFTVDLPSDESAVPNQASKKITLQPKMKEAPDVTPPKEFKPIGEGVSKSKSAHDIIKLLSDVEAGDDQGKSDRQATADARADNALSDEDKRNSNFRTPDKFGMLSASESFRQLTLGGEVNRFRVGSEDRPSPQGMGAFVFSSPEVGFNRKALIGTTPLSTTQKEPLSDSNFTTPDSENRRARKQSWEVMPKLPELSMLPVERGGTTNILKEAKETYFSEYNYTTPDNSRSFCRMPKLPEMPLISSNKVVEPQGKASKALLDAASVEKEEESPSYVIGHSTTIISKTLF